MKIVASAFFVGLSYVVWMSGNETNALCRQFLFHLYILLLYLNKNVFYFASFFLYLPYDYKLTRGLSYFRIIPCQLRDEVWINVRFEIEIFESDDLKNWSHSELFRNF